MKVIKVLLIIGLIAAAFLKLGPVLAAENNFTAEKIIAKSRLAFYYTGKDMKAKVFMELINKGGRKRIRDLVMLRKNEQKGGNQKYFMYFYKPADVRGITFMVYKYPDRDDDRWLFIPAINLVKRIAANDKYSSFVGSDFTYEDISGRKPTEDTHTLLRQEKLNGKESFVIESIPKKTSVYTKRISWIDKKTYLPLKEEFYDKQNELYRVFEALVIKDIDGFPTVTGRVMRNVKTGHRTEVTLRAVQYNLGIEDNLFSERYLRRPPLKWIR
ncbi:MAG: outer membrane lipoprotein-sorting protein [Nitrospirae bacterium]|nr:outer membrane lipoprotein-sorting protein [Nitrospirota bacterium]